MTVQQTPGSFAFSYQSLGMQRSLLCSNTKMCFVFYRLNRYWCLCFCLFFWGGRGGVTLKLDGLTFTFSGINQIHLHAQTQTHYNFTPRVLQLQCWTATPASDAACQNIALAGINSTLRKLSQEQWILAEPCHAFACMSGLGDAPWAKCQSIDHKGD